MKSYFQRTAQQAAILDLMRATSLFSLFLLFSTILKVECVFGDEPNQASAQTLRFNKDVRPILSSACYRCHGFDAKTREANLRLDAAEGAFQVRDSGKAAIAPGNLTDSLVWERIVSTDPDLVMPPPSSNRQLTEEEKKTISQWVEQGAVFEKHWAFEPIVVPASPTETIDQFLSKEQQAKGLEIQPIADPVTQVRRLAFTLTGLPPELADVEAFAADASNEHYDRLIEKYLASPHYGEEMAKHWLDVARYGDTHGLHLDNERKAWGFRDWVVDAFNRNVPFNEFTIEQLAGDLLPNPTQSQLVATGFNRCNVTTSEGGAINDEFLFRYAVDRTSTTVQAWLGLTGGCAVCHDHKYDPISTKEFYSLYAFFYNAADPAMDGNTDTTSPFLPLPSDEQRRALDVARQREADALETLRKLASAREVIDDELERNAANVTSTPMTSIWMDDQFNPGAGTRNTTRNETVWNSEGGVPMGERSLHQEFGNRLEQVVTGGLRPLWIPEQASLKVWLRTDLYEPPKAAFMEIRTNSTTKQFVWSNSAADATIAGFDPARIVGPLPQPGKWTLLTLPVSDLPVGDRVAELKLGLFGGICDWDGLVCSGIQRPNDLLTADLQTWWKSVQGTDVPFAAGDLAKALKEGPESESGKSKRDEVAQFFRMYISEATSPLVLSARQQWYSEQVSRSMLESSIAGTFIYNDLAKPREAFVMTRGQYDQKGERVYPNTPAALPSLSKDSQREQPNRLDLAKWLVSDENPLTARVTINRLWQQVFGVGIVKTSDDFGSQGSPPVHPELLDALAFRYRANGWNTKEMIKEMVRSDAFRRSATVTTASWNIDPENRYLARGPRIRLDAEQIRDNVLAVSGLLNRAMGGLGVKGYQPANIWEPVGYGDSNTRYYVQDHGNALYRRSLYSFIKRTAPPPFMSNFDAPNRELFCTRRERSNTPLQALQLMNDIQYVEAARVLAESVLSDASIPTERRIQRIFQLSLSRVPTATEQEAMALALSKFQSRFQEHLEDAKKLVYVGEKPTNSLIPSQDLAAYTLLANLVLNLDETVNRN